MIWEISSCLALTAVLAAPLGAADLSSTITVLIYNYATIPSDVLVQTEAETAKIYEHCGIKILWLSCPLSASEIDRSPDCRLPPRPTWLALRILSQPIAERGQRLKKTFGFAISPEDGSFATVSNVFAHDADQLAKRRGMPGAVILGYVVSHELGHLLLGPESHGTSGIMQCPWRLEELQNIARGFLMFTPEEAERMRADIQARKTGKKGNKTAFVPGP